MGTSIHLKFVSICAQNGLVLVSNARQTQMSSCLLNSVRNLCGWVRKEQYCVLNLCSREGISTANSHSNCGFVPTKKEVN